MQLLAINLQIGNVLAFYDGALSPRIIFQKESKILIAEKFVNVQFIEPFPKYNVIMKTEMRNYLNKTSENWRSPSIECKLEFSTKFNSTTDPFNVNWMLDMIETKAKAARDEAQVIRTDTSQFLNKNPTESLFSSGIMMGGVFNSGGCGILGIFGSCQDRALTNAKNI